MKGALDAGLVADQAIQVFFELLGCSCGVRAGPDFHASDAAEIPGSTDQQLEHGLLGGALRLNVGLVVVEQFLEFLALIGRDDQVASGEAVGSSVLGRASPAFRRASSGAVLSIGNVGFASCWCICHIYNL